MQGINYTPPHAFPTPTQGAPVWNAPVPTVPIWQGVQTPQETSPADPRFTQPVARSASEAAAASAPPWSPPASLPTFGGLSWGAFRLPTGDTGYTAAAPGGGFYYYGPDGNLYLSTKSGQEPAGEAPIGNVSTFFSSPTGTAPTTPTTPPSGGSGSGGTTTGSSVLDQALANLLSGGTMQSPLDAASSPSDAALQALQPTSAPTSSTSNPAILVLVGAAVLAAAVWFYFKHKHKKPELPK